MSRNFRLNSYLLVDHLRMTDETHDHASVEEEKDMQSLGDENDPWPGPQESSLQQTKERPKMLPEITPELIKEHEAQLRASAGSVARGHGVANGPDMESPTCCHFICPCHQEDEHGEPVAICGIPYYLFMIMAALVAAVTAGTVLAVVYYDPNAPDNPSQSPTMTPPPSIVFQSNQPT